MSLSLIQHQLIIGMVLGDSTVEKNGNNMRIRTVHAESQRDYLFWKYQFLKNISNKPRFVERFDRRTTRVYRSWVFSTRSIEVLQLYRDCFYDESGRKRIPSTISSLFDSGLTLAVWFMDDGYKRNDCRAYRLNTDGFTRKENEILRKVLREKFNLITSLHKKGKYWNLYFPSSQVDRFNQIVESHIVRSMRYKLI